jgi:hypothetical protein
LAQPYSAGNSKTEKRCIGNKSCQSAKPQHTASHTESSGDQAAARTEVGASVAHVEIPAPIAFGQTCTLVEAIALSEAQARLSL